MVVTRTKTLRRPPAFYSPHSSRGEGYVTKNKGVVTNIPVPTQYS